MNQCPCCDYFTLTSEDYEICPICFWEQDYFDIELPDETSGENRGLTIREARLNFRAYGACCVEMVKNVLLPHKRIEFTYEERNIE